MYEVSCVVTLLYPKDVFGDRPAIFRKTNELLVPESLISQGDGGEVLTLDMIKFKRFIRKWGYQYLPCHEPVTQETAAKRLVAQQRWEDFRQSLSSKMMAGTENEEKLVSSRYWHKKYPRHSIHHDVVAKIERPNTAEQLGKKSTYNRDHSSTLPQVPITQTKPEANQSFRVKFPVVSPLTSGAGATR